MGAHVRDAERGQIGQRLEELEVVRGKRLGRGASSPQDTDLGAPLSSQRGGGRLREAGAEGGEQVGSLETGSLLEGPHTLTSTRSASALITTAAARARRSCAVVWVTMSRAGF